MLYCMQTLGKRTKLEDTDNLKWEKVHGVITPGGDPAWKCPICGKGEHIYGVEHENNKLDSCPNCGASLTY